MAKKKKEEEKRKPTHPNITANHSTVLPVWKNGGVRSPFLPPCIIVFYIMGPESILLVAGSVVGKNGRYRRVLQAHSEEPESVIEEKFFPFSSKQFPPVRGVDSNTFHYIISKAFLSSRESSWTMSDFCVLNKATSCTFRMCRP